MPESLKTEFIHINNSCKPSLQQIEKSMFEAAERYVSLQAHKQLAKNGRGKEKTTGLAVSITAGESAKKDSSFKPFSLCTVGEKLASHPISKCPNYGTNNLKTAKLKEMGACLKCSGTTHKSVDLDLTSHVISVKVNILVFFVCPRKMKKEKSLKTQKQFSLEQ